MNCCIVLEVPSSEHRRVLSEIVFEMVEEEEVLKDLHDYAHDLS